MGDLEEKVTEFVKTHMQIYDASHDFSGHIRRVLALSRVIEHRLRDTNPEIRLDSQAIILASLMHDVGDKKYLASPEHNTTLVERTLIDLGADSALAKKVQQIVSNVSYTHEINNPEMVQSVLVENPELGIVQDADRLDAIGAIGIGRTFTYNAAHGDGLALEAAVKHVDEKLLKLAPMMKTEPGREMARVRTERLRLFQEWWREESLDC